MQKKKRMEANTNSRQSEFVLVSCKYPLGQLRQSSAGIMGSWYSDKFTMTTLIGEIFADFKIQTQPLSCSVFHFNIH